MEYFFEVKSRLNLQDNGDKKTSKLISVDCRLNVSPSLKQSRYHNQEGTPTTIDGIEAVTLALISGLITTVHFAHKKGYKNDAEHLRFIISELERGLIGHFDIK